MPSSPSLFKRVFLPALLLFALAGFATRLAVDREFRGWFDPAFWQAWWRVGEVMTLAHQDYLHPEAVTYDKLGEHAVSHVLDGLDRYTTYLDPADFNDLQNQTDQQLVGAGVEIEHWQGRVQITHVFPGSPAAKSGWQEGDRIIAIGSTDTRDFSVASVSALLRGPSGTDVTVTLDRPGQSDPLVRTFTRHSFDIPSIQDAQLRPDGIGYLKLTEFGRNSGKEIAYELSRLQSLGMSGLILDLRDNPGGMLNATLEVLKPLLQPGQLVTYTLGRDDIREEFRIDDTPDPAAQFSGPMAVLINGNSASSAEIVAGALQDTNRAVLVGERSYGKGVVQTEFSIPGGGVKLTTQAWYLPSGRTIQDKGLKPNVEVPLSSVDSEILRLQEADLRRLTPAQFTQAYGFAPRADPQLDTAAALVLAAADRPLASLPKLKSAP